MFYQKLLLFILILIIPFEAALVSIPLFFMLSIVAYVFYPQVAVVLLVFMGSLVLDSLRMMPFGLSAVIILGVFVLIEMLKGEVILSGYKLIILFLFVSSFIYAKSFNYSDNIFIYLFLFIATFAALAYFSKQTLWLK